MTTAVTAKYYSPANGVNPYAAPTHVVFCNGINTSLSSAQTTANRISHMLGDRPVGIFHTPSGLFWDGQMGDTELNTASINLLAQTIVGFFGETLAADSTADKPRVILFAHSHGAFLCKNALESIAMTNQVALAHIEFYGFGGAAMVPRNLGRDDCVINYVNKNDATQIAGNQFLDSAGGMNVLYMKNRLTKKMEEMQVGAEEVETAARQLATDDCIISICIKDRSRLRAFKEAVGALPFTPAESAQVEARTQEYIAIHDEYDIRLSAGHALPPTDQQANGLLSSIGQSIWAGLVFGYHHFYGQHSLETGYPAELRGRCAVLSATF